MGLAIEYRVDPHVGCYDELKWCQAQGWKHIIDWRYFRSGPQNHTAEFQFENPQHAHWFILRWGGTVTGEI